MAHFLSVMLFGPSVGCAITDVVGAGTEGRGEV
jgi:hypothetical protein